MVQFILSEIYLTMESFIVCLCQNPCRRLLILVQFNHTVSLGLLRVLRRAYVSSESLFRGLQFPLVSGLVSYSLSFAVFNLAFAIFKMAFADLFLARASFRSSRGRFYLPRRSFEIVT